MLNFFASLILYLDKFKQWMSTYENSGEEIICSTFQQNRSFPFTLLKYIANYVCQQNPWTVDRLYLRKPHVLIKAALNNFRKFFLVCSSSNCKPSLLWRLTALFLRNLPVSCIFGWKQIVLKRKTHDSMNASQKKLMMSMITQLVKKLAWN